jgi:hypothetical protein
VKIESRVLPITAHSATAVSISFSDVKMIDNARTMFFGGDFADGSELFEAVHLVECHQVDFGFGLSKDIILDTSLGLL